MDLCSGLPLTDRGVDCMAVFVCRLSKRIHVMPCRKDINAEALAYLFFDTVWRHHGMPRGIVSDRDSRFCGDFWRALFEWTGTSLRMSTAAHPETDGQTERANRTLLSMLRAYSQERPEDWDLRLAACEYAYNDSLQASTGYTPFYLEYGQDPLTPAALLRPAEAERSRMESTAAFVSRLNGDIQDARKHLTAAQARQRATANRRRLPHTFEVGDQVLISTKNLAATVDEPVRKFRARYEGPYRIIAKVTPVSFRLNLPESAYSIHPVLHVSFLEHYHERAGGVRSSPPGPDPQVQPVWYERGAPVWEVERIVKRRQTKPAQWRKVGSREQWIPPQYEYLVKWQGFPARYNTWEPESVFRSAAEELREAFDIEVDGLLSRNP